VRHLLLLVILLGLMSPLQVSGKPLMVGYTGFYMLPLLDGGTLEFEVGEPLWVMAPNPPTKVYLESPEGVILTYSLNSSRPQLLRIFSEEDAGGWTLISENGDRLHLEVRDPERMGVKALYSLSPTSLTISLTGSSRAAILSQSSERILLIAGVEQTVRLGNLTDGELVIDLFYPESFLYEGVAEGSNYTLHAEALVGRLVGKVRQGLLTLELPRLHEVGAGGVLPLREGSASLRVTSNETVGKFPVYVLNKAFEDFAGKPVDRKAVIHLEEALDSSLSVLLPNPENPEETQTLILRPPLAAARFYDPLHGVYVGNLTIETTRLQAVAVNETAYFLLRDVDELYPKHSKKPRIGDDDITVYVNGFRAASMKIALRQGEVTSSKLDLKLLRIKVLSPDNRPAENVKLRINGRIFGLKSGCGGFLLPSGDYRVKAFSGGLRAESHVKLENDAELTLRLSRPLRLEEILRFTAAAQLLGLLILILLNLQAARVFKVRKWKR